MCTKHDNLASLRNAPVVLWGTAALLMACASAPPRNVGRSANALQAPPVFASLPDVPKAQQSTRVVRGLSLARHVLTLGLPAPPDDRRYATLQAWIDQEVSPWISTRRENVDETRFEFAQSESHSQAEGVIALGTIGLLQENTALELSHIPLPAELDTEPEIADIFRDLVETQAKPFRNAAVVEYQKCSELADHADSELRRWRDFCEARVAKLSPPAR